jgi:hypothetical protein
MKSSLLCWLVVLTLFVASGTSRNAPQGGPLQVDLSKPGDAMVITLNGKHVGGLRVDKEGRLGIYGPNQSSTAITIDGRDRIQLCPEPVKSPAVRLTVADDVWMSGVLRVGKADAFGDAPLDPNGAIQVGRNLAVAQAMSVFRVFGQGRERFRLGLTEEGHGFWSNGPHDTPLVTLRPASEDKTTAAQVEFHGRVKEAKAP